MKAKNRAASILIGLTVLFGAASVHKAQESSNQQQTQQQKEKSTPEEKAVLLLDQIIADAAVLRLSENRIFIQISAGDLL